MPRIAHVISTVHGVGGAERLLAGLLEEGDRTGWDQLVLNPFVNDPSAALARLLGSERCRGYGSRGRAGVAATRRWVGRELHTFRPDVVHVLLFRALLVVATLPRRRPHARVQTHAYGEAIRLPPYGPAKERLDRWAGKRYDHAVAISTSGRRLLVEEYGYPDSDVSYIAPGWEGEPHPRSSNGPPTVVCVAKLRPEKGHDVLLDAHALVRRDVPGARLVLVGDGDLQPALEARARALGIGDAVDFAGGVPDIWPYLAAADVFALASRAEAFGIAAVEAMAAGLPVVGPATGGLLDLVRPGVTGDLFPPGDHRALAGRLVHLLRDDALRDRMSQAARQEAEPFRRDSTVRRYFELFTRLAERSRSVQSSGPLGDPDVLRRERW